MNQVDTINLNNVDPDDIADALIIVEKSFGFRFSETELKNVQTFGELCDIIINKMQREHANDCTTQQAFYKLRSAISKVQFLNKNTIIPGTKVQHIIPKQKRRQRVKQLKRELGFDLDILETKRWLKWIMYTGITLSLVMFFFKWQFALAGLVFFNLFGWITHKFFATEIDAQRTVGQLAQELTRKHYIIMRRNQLTVNRIEVINKVKEIFSLELLLNEDILTREASFI